MHHIKNNLKSFRSAELISAALFELLKEKTYEKITITDIYRKSFVSRATFYRLFDNIDDVLYYEVDKVFYNMKEELAAVDYPNILRFFIEKTILNLDLFKTIIQNKKYSIIVSCFEKHNEDILSTMTFINPDNQIQAFYELEIFGGILLATLSAWHKFEQKENFDQLTQRVITSIGSLNILFNLNSQKADEV
ncbi:MAG TPA: TetR/AcrR family transcriptional regulator [Erysipelotrichaceae bacterium]|nr:TetR/AcrR family transcriptional regulator [Erysipelotrichaceae bacterium]HQB32156.1 TetR/AcrR family transcriptional regulator [Erysipelotrichaceae bacterium]